MAFEVTQEHIDNAVNSFKAVGIDVDVLMYKHIENKHVDYYAVGNGVFVELEEWKYFEVENGKVMYGADIEYNEYQFLNADFTGLTIEQCIKLMIENKLLEPCDEWYVDCQHGFYFRANDIVDVYLGNSPFTRIQD